MGAKRALIVDDSKSARLFLARILEKYEIDVDNAENAEAAIEYLTSHRPDVIFMDHLMPGMDGFQAVQAIKNNPLTATIPIMMYTSQEGELYLGQARALGAVGVLPKQIKPTDVSKVLYQLHLVADRRTAFQGTFRAINVPGAGASEPANDQSAANDSGVMPKILTETSLREQFAELRRALVAGVDTQTERITAEIRALLLEALPPATPPEASSAPPGRPAAQWGWIVACIALAIALATTALWWQQVNQLRTLSGEVAQLRHDLTQPQDVLSGEPAPGASATDSSDAASGGAAQDAAGETAAGGTSVPGGSSTAGAQSLSTRPLPTDAKPLVVPVPYGTEALGGTRLELIRQLLDRLVSEKHVGSVDIKAFAGRFCLLGNGTDGFSLAPDETPFSKCDVVGNPSDDALSPAQRTPLPFANLVGGVRNTSRGMLDVLFSQGDPATNAAAYPQASPELTAGEWNRAGSANNRIEIRVR
jgi:CheY-like chemotaxis protein